MFIILELYGIVVSFLLILISFFITTKQNGEVTATKMIIEIKISLIFNKESPKIFFAYIYIIHYFLIKLNNYFCA